MMRPTVNHSTLMNGHSPFPSQRSKIRKGFCSTESILLGVLFSVAFITILVSNQHVKGYANTSSQNSNSFSTKTQANQSPSSQSDPFNRPPANKTSAVELFQEHVPSSATITRIIPNATTPVTSYAGTIVTAYFRLKSKHSSDTYETNWMQHMLSLQDPMVIFTHEEMAPAIAQMRQHAPTVLISMKLTDLPLARLRRDIDHFWLLQLSIDPERKLHQSYQLFWIWLAKGWFVQEAIRLHPFEDIVTTPPFYMWSDIGCFRRKQYHGRLLLNPRAIQTVVPDTQTTLWMAHHDTSPPDYWLWNDKYDEKSHFFHSGSQGAGYATAWKHFVPKVAATIDTFVEARMFVGEDQCVLQSTCLQFPEYCAYVPTKQVPDNHYFGLRHVLHYEAKKPYQLWRAPSGIPKEKI